MCHYARKLPPFYKVAITQELDEAVKGGIRPISNTVVQRFEPIQDERARGNGMLSLAARSRILQSFVLFKSLAHRG